VHKSIQFVLSASLALCLNSLLVAQTNARANIGVASVLQAYNYNPEISSKTSGIQPQSNPGSNSCWSQSTLGSSEEPAFLLDEVSFTATVNMNAYCRGELGNYTGQFVFYDYNTVLGSVQISTDTFSATFTTNSLTAGRHHIQATFLSNSYYKSSSAEIPQDVDRLPAPVTLSVTPSASAYGQVVTFTATVTSGVETPTGKVRFSDGIKDIGLATLDVNGVATFTKKNLAVGTYPITAEYFGDAISAQSVTPAVTLVVESTVTMPE
jgi:Bacterial Ig-like domain (group 3)